MQKLGQHFLKNLAALQTIVDALDPQEKETIIEIGPGHGELTLPLAHAAERFGSKVIAIEKDRSLIAPLAASIKKDAPGGAVSIIEGDALKLLPGVAEDLAHYIIAGNIPYYITGKLLRVISELENTPRRVALLIQKEVAERICAAPPAMNRLAASVQFWAEVKIVAHVPRTDFSPPPKVDSAVITLSTKKTLPEINSSRYYRAVRAIFAQPRKTLLNNLSAIAENGGGKGDLAKQLGKIGINPGARPQDLSIQDIIAIANALPWG